MWNLTSQLDNHFILCFAYYMICIQCPVYYIRCVLYVFGNVPH